MWLPELEVVRLNFLHDSGCTCGLADLEYEQRTEREEVPYFGVLKLTHFYLVCPCCQAKAEYYQPQPNLLDDVE